MNLKRHFIGLLFGLCGGLGISVAAGILMNSGPFLDGGMEMVVQFWKNNGNGFSDAWKWQALLGVALGAIGGILL